MSKYTVWWKNKYHPHGVIFREYTRLEAWERLQTRPQDATSWGIIEVRLGGGVAS